MSDRLVEAPEKEKGNKRCEEPEQPKIVRFVQLNEVEEVDQEYGCCNDQPQVPLSKVKHKQCIKHNENNALMVKSFQKEQKEVEKEKEKQRQKCEREENFVNFVSFEEYKRISPEFYIMLRERPVVPIPTFLTTPIKVIAPSEEKQLHNEICGDPTAVNENNPQLAKYLDGCMTSNDNMNEIYSIDFYNNIEPLDAARNAIELIDPTEFTCFLERLACGGTLTPAQLQYLIYFLEAAAELSPQKLELFLSFPQMGNVMTPPIRCYLESLLMQKGGKLTPIQLRMLMESLQQANARNNSAQQKSSEQNQHLCRQVNGNGAGASKQIDKQESNKKIVETSTIPKMTTTTNRRISGGQETNQHQGFNKASTKQRTEEFLSPIHESNTSKEHVKATNCTIATMKAFPEKELDSIKCDEVLSRVTTTDMITTNIHDNDDNEIDPMIVQGVEDDKTKLIQKSKNKNLNQSYKRKSGGGGATTKRKNKTKRMTSSKSDIDKLKKIIKYKSKDKIKDAKTESNTVESEGTSEASVSNENDDHDQKIKVTNECNKKCSGYIEPWNIAVPWNNLHKHHLQKSSAFKVQKSMILSRYDNPNIAYIRGMEKYTAEFHRDNNREKFAKVLEEGRQKRNAAIDILKTRHNARTTAVMQPINY